MTSVLAADLFSLTRSEQENLSPNRGDLTPPMMASERLLDPSDTQTQFASYHGDTDPKGQQWDVPESGSHSLHEHIAAEWRGVQL
jgi:hypothetical protein